MKLSELRNYLYSEEVVIVFKHSGIITDKIVEETIALAPQYFSERLKNYENLKVSHISADDCIIVIEVEL